MEDTIGLVIEWSFRLLSAALILVAGYMIGNWLKNTISKLDKLDGILKSFLGTAAKYAILVIALITVLGQFGVQTASLLAVLGAAGLAIGLALQGTLSNVAAGVMLLILRPFNVGDFVEFAGVSGTVKDLGLFTTELSSVENIHTVVPNSAVWGSEILNYSRNKQRRQDIVNGISYSDDINKAMKSIQKILDSEKRLVTSKGKEPAIVVSALGDSAVEITARIWTSTADYWAVRWDLTKALKEALDKDGLNIPFPTTTLDISADSAAALRGVVPKAVSKVKKKAA